MNTLQHHKHHGHHSEEMHHTAEDLHHPSHTEKDSVFKIAMQATLHCLLGCGIGEIVGIILAASLGLGMWESMIVGILLGFVFGFTLGMIPLVKAGFSFIESFKTILVSEGLSILVMEGAEAITQVYIPGVMEAGLSESIFWYGMGISLFAGFIAALPVNLLLISRGIRHHH
ncbi:MAG TPA: DUF4396 domain-containing protein [Leptospiraceae bacterium]|nr:DUF4396 domain-containing protein [Leptospiraceae bacterium]HMX34655.1 DUF4396 domain-containing protein [Leptospiraceae bacterium]HMY33714.1 DUF4396 domain-containing protein [Leptospiraceae bacterium]HMZ66191.1 DUF4396 domain-containing protein [Leptospiraceae bacterium]HNA05353.1 DUF4396 domain-containing protein [Leptospiraceae bacterium]